jgi:AcrR family transcriptional regulator
MSMQQIGRRRRRPKHQWSTTEGTKRSILDAARTIFGKHGFGDANVAEVVELAGSSIGSLYHHFGGKAEVFVALWERYNEGQQALVEEAVAQAGDNPWDAFLAACKVLLESAWESRDLVRIFSEGDSPAGFVKELADQRKVQVTDLLKDLRPADDAVARAVVLTFSSALAEGRREIARSRSAADAKTLAANMLRVIGELRPLVKLR